MSNCIANKPEPTARQNAKVTFVMPAFNAAEFISHAIESVKAQTIPDWKLIIINDGSSDNTLAIAEKYAETDSRISVLNMPAPSGTVLLPRKKGIIEADTEFVSPLDADDWIEDIYLEKLSGTLKKATADIVYPTMWETCGPDDSNPSRYAPVDDCFYDKEFTGRDTVRFTLDSWRIGAGGGLIRRSVYLEAFERYDSSATHAYADELLTRQILFLARIVSFSDARYFYRVNPSSVTHAISPRKFHYLINNIKLIDFCKTEYSENSREYLLAQRQNFHSIFDALSQLKQCGLKGDDKKDVIRLIRDSKNNVDHSVIKGNVSPRYYALLKLPFSLISIILSLYGRIRK